jgi:hypothetical protein
MGVVLEGRDLGTVSAVVRAGRDEAVAARFRGRRAGKLTHLRELIAFFQGETHEDERS